MLSFEVSVLFGFFFTFRVVVFVFSVYMSVRIYISFNYLFLF